MPNLFVFYHFYYFCLIYSFIYLFIYFVYLFIFIFLNFYLMEVVSLVSNKLSQTGRYVFAATINLNLNF